MKIVCFFFQAEDGIRDIGVTGVQTCALPIYEHAIRLVLVKLSQLAADVPEIRELDVNPLLADQNGVIAVDARVRVAAEKSVPRACGHSRFAVRPYPKEWEFSFAIRSGRRVFVRPVRPEDEGLFR